MSKRLQITLYVITAYLTVFAVMFLFLPSVAEKVLSNTLPDKALNMLYGQLTLTFAYVAFLASRGGKLPHGSRHALEFGQGPAPSFDLPFKGHLGASDEEARINPRARSAKLRAGIRTTAAPLASIADDIGVRVPKGTRH